MSVTQTTELDDWARGYYRSQTTTSLPTMVDQLALAALRSGKLAVDAHGLITDEHGKPAVRPRRSDGSGLVRVQRYPRSVWAPAHRVVWLALYGSIPERGYIRHHDGHLWNNEPGNLYVSTTRGCVTNG